MGGPLNNSHVIATKGSPNWAGGIRTYGNLLNCCGLGAIQGFSTPLAFQTWKDEAEFVSLLYRTYYTNGHMLYCLASYQLNTNAHKALLNIGAKQVAEFPNLTHGPSILSLWLVNVRDACGRYCNKYGEPYDEKPKDDSEVDDVRANKPSAYIPRRGYD